MPPPVHPHRHSHWYATPHTSLRHDVMIARPSCRLVWKQFSACALSVFGTTDRMAATTLRSTWRSWSISSTRHAPPPGVLLFSVLPPEPVERGVGGKVQGSRGGSGVEREGSGVERKGLGRA
eukprot:354973-Chlamydomonas_euryale.AAC.4